MPWTAEGPAAAAAARLSLGGSRRSGDLPIEASITEVEAQAEQKGRALPVADVLAGAPQHRVAGADYSAMRTEQELMGVALLVDPDIRAENGVIEGITILRRAEPKNAGVE